MGHLEKPRTVTVQRLLEAAERAASRHVSMPEQTGPVGPDSLAELLTSIRSLTPAGEQTDSAEMIRALRHE
jgi:hypothetical protein